MRDLVIIGAGGFGREVYALAQLKGKDVWLLDHHKDMLFDKDYDVLVAVGDTTIRKAIVEQLESDLRWVNCGSTWGQLSDPTVRFFGPIPVIGVIICAGTVISTDIELGKHAHINFSCTIGHDCIIGDFITISPGVHISGNVTIGDEVFIGTGAVIREKLTIGKGATIGMGAVVVKDVPPGVTVVGNPAREINEMKKLFWKVKTKKAQAEPIDYESNNNPECTFINPRLLCGICGDGFIMYGTDEMKQVHPDDWEYMKELIQEYSIGTFR